MNILIAVNKGFVERLNVLLNSINISNPNNNFDVYILHRELDEKDIKKIKIIRAGKRFNLKIIKVAENEINELPQYQKRYPAEIYFRLFATKFLPKELDRILYLDADTIVINKLDKLYEMDFEGNYYIAATHATKLEHKFNEIRLDIKKEEPYINSGVLLINLQELRKTNIEKDVIKYVKENSKKLILPDQDIIAALYGNKIKLVDALKYNLGDRGLSWYNINNPKKQIRLKWVCKNAVIIHYYGKNKPWNKNYRGILDCFYKKTEKIINNNINEKL